MCTVIERFLSYIKINDGCWEWQGYRDENGYGKFTLRHNHPVRAHRFIYEYYYGHIDPKLVIDHLCRNPACVNPLHLELVTVRENTLRGNGLTSVHAKKTHCIRGHPLSGDNLYMQKKGRMCRKCNLENSKKRKKKVEFRNL